MGMFENAPQTNQENHPITEEETEQNKENIITKLYGHCFEIAKLEEGEDIPTGGSSYLSTEVDKMVKGDFEKFQEFLKETHDLTTKYHETPIQEWLNSQGVNINVKTFIQLLAFTKNYKNHYPNNPENNEMRHNLYKEKGKELRLSDIFNANSAECAENAALAQFFLQQEGTSSIYFGGEVAWSREDEFPEQHSFVVIQQNNETYIYDPTNPTKTTGEDFPSLYTTKVNFEEEMKKNKKTFVTATNVLSKQEVYYGVGDATNLNAEKDII